VKVDEHGVVLLSLESGDGRHHPGLASKYLMLTLGNSEDISRSDE